MRRTGAERYEVQMTQEDGVWLIEAVGLVGVRSFGRTVSAAVSNIREAIAAAEDLDDWDGMRFDFVLPNTAATDALREFRAADSAEEDAAAERERALRAVVESLRSAGLSYRDIGTVIGMSHQRVAQLANHSRV